MTRTSLLLTLLLLVLAFAASASAAGLRQATSERSLGNNYERGSQEEDNGDNNNDNTANQGQSNRMPLGLAVVTSTKSLDDTYNDLIAALDGNPNIRVVSEIDHAAAAEGVGLELAPNRLVLFGNPALGTPLMLQDQRVGLDLPQKMLVWQDDDDDDDETVYLGYNSVDYLTSRYPDIAGTPQLETIAGALANLASAATGVPAEDIMNDAKMSSQQQSRLENRKTFRQAKSDFDFDTTLNNLKSAIDASPANLAVELDHAANAATVDQDLRPTTLLVFGNPNLGTPLMQAGGSAGIDLPLKMLVWEDDKGDVYVTTNAPYFLRFRHGLRRVGGQIDAVRNAVVNFLNAATTSSNNDEDP